MPSLHPDETHRSCVLSKAVCICNILKGATLVKLTDRLSLETLSTYNLENSINFFEFEGCQCFFEIKNQIAQTIITLDYISQINMYAIIIFHKNFQKVPLTYHCETC